MNAIYRLINDKYVDLSNIATIDKNPSPFDGRPNIVISQKIGNQIEIGTNWYNVFLGNAEEEICCKYFDYDGPVKIFEKGTKIPAYEIDKNGYHYVRPTPNTIKILKQANNDAINMMLPPLWDDDGKLIEFAVQFDLFFNRILLAWQTYKEKEREYMLLLAKHSNIFTTNNNNG
jgi:hypothetical protein